MHKSNALCVGACEQQDTVADHPVAQQDGRVIEEHEVDEVAPDGAGRSANHAEERVRDRGRAGDAGVVDEDGDVDVTVRTVPATGLASEQPGGLQAGFAGEVRCQPAQDVLELVGVVRHRCLRIPGIPANGSSPVAIRFCAVRALILSGVASNGNP